MVKTKVVRLFWGWKTSKTSNLTFCCLYKACVSANSQFEKHLEISLFQHVKPSETQPTSPRSPSYWRVESTPSAKGGWPQKISSSDRMGLFLCQKSHVEDLVLKNIDRCFVERLWMWFGQYGNQKKNNLLGMFVSVKQGPKILRPRRHPMLFLPLDIPKIQKSWDVSTKGLASRDATGKSPSLIRSEWCLRTWSGLNKSEHIQ